MLGLEGIKSLTLTYFILIYIPSISVTAISECNGPVLSGA